MTGEMAEFIIPSSVRRWLPLAFLVALIALAYGFGLQKYFSLQMIAENHVRVENYVSENLALALALFTLVYIIVVALSLPGAAVLSIIGGYLFGVLISVPVTIITATLGSIVVFRIVKTSAGAAMAEKASPFVKRLTQGFADDAFNYLLFLRLAPVFPFFAVNAVAGLARVNTITFITATFFGIMPGAVAFAYLGRGLGSVIEMQMKLHEACVAEKGAALCPFEISSSSLITPPLLMAFAGLAVVALIPVALKSWKRQT